MPWKPDRCACGTMKKREAAQCRSCWRNRIQAEVAPRFWGRVLRGDGCWEWQGPRNAKGYGKLGLRYVHRVAWELTNGPIPAGLEVCHHCDNPPCARPEHLFLGSRLDNARDKVAKGRAVGGGCRGARHPRAIVTEGQVRHIRARVANGEGPAAIAERLGLKRVTVQAIASRRNWHHI